MTALTLFGEVDPPSPSSGFAEFYKAYPKHVGRMDAEKAYRQAMKKGASHAAIMRGVRQYAAECAGKDPQFIKYPGGWLRAGRWEDEPEGHANGTGPHSHRTDSSSRQSNTTDILAGVAAAADRRARERGRNPVSDKSPITGKPKPD